MFKNPCRTKPAPKTHTRSIANLGFLVLDKCIRTLQEGAKPYTVQNGFIQKLHSTIGTQCQT